MKLFKPTPPTDDSLKDFLISKKNRFHQNVSEVLQYLMSELNMSEGELSRRTGVPQPSIHRIISGKTPKPRQENLEKLASFFGISIDQMVARIPLSEDRVVSSVNDAAVVDIKIPVISWETIGAWLDFNQTPSDNKISVDHEISSKAYALVVDEAHQIIEFKVGTTLIFDPQKLPTPGDYVVFCQKGSCYFGELILKNNKYYLDTNNKIMEVANEYRFLGVLIESRRAFIA